ncbi:DUF1501 domain-containing protein [Rhodobacter sp. SGA-6-6]|uniref:DUF1501 domain-containing protein n=1 Tax=Rhodobacter sp. SGA-6-6 TaxID=2710882 RepID=UPI0013EB16ED|nr:DUF1501 domain-containing protein [Rhodobacter sp. SGA-6-6]NGM46110.1 DUF1501 domain-containing protein [Rhodobacter sp. SGA-6-6]
MALLHLTRRSFLTCAGAAALGSMVSEVVFAAAGSENRLVTILLRGAMDGLDVIRPLGDPDYAGLRPTLLSQAPGGLPLDDRFALHPALEALHPLWQSGEFAFAHALALPYRKGRSHFIGQDALEHGSGRADGAVGPARDGWLNRAIGLIPGADGGTGLSVGQERLMIMEGGVPTGHWFPVEENQLSAQGRSLLDRLHREDPLTGPAFAAAMELATAGGKGKILREAEMYDLLGQELARQLLGPARIAAFALNGWDTHQRQTHLIGERLPLLARVILSLRAALGEAWGRTLVLTMTEFGRTARENGSGGTDHGTGGVMLAAGGLLRGGRAFGDWPGLAEADLLDRRDLMPVDDLRRYPAHALRALFGLEARQLEEVVFPGLDLGRDPGLIL